MTPLARRLPRGGRVGRRLGSVASAVSAVSTKELRGRMRGRRAFVVVTVYLLLLSAFAFGIYTYLKQASGLVATDPGMGFPRPMPMPGYGVAEAGLAASIGHGLFGGLLMVETLLVLLLAPAFTSGAISIEREKQTLDLLVTTPLSTTGMVVGKLVSALTYVFLLIVASIPLASLVFVFGGVGPEDLVRGYLFLFALAFGMGALGLFVSALLKRTQSATVLTYVIVLALTLGTAGLHQFLVVTTQSSSGGSIISQQRHRAPEALLWLNPFVANADLICATTPNSYHETCAYLSRVTGRPYFGSQWSGGVVDVPIDAPAAAPPVEAQHGAAVGRLPLAATSSIGFGFPRDTFWPKSAAAFTVLGLLSTVLAAQLVAPSRRLRIRRPIRRNVVLVSTEPAADVVRDEIEELDPANGPTTETVTDEP
ncbi:MAG TPA: ABC transporter permease [Candidatus Limnocylindrales bacterium]|nr:ABC transporter permease [Candidatus Limnocylindrales bacterium]